MEKIVWYQVEVLAFWFFLMIDFRSVHYLILKIIWDFTDMFLKYAISHSNTLKYYK